MKFCVLQYNPYTFKLQMLEEQNMFFMLSSHPNYVPPLREKAAKQQEQWYIIRRLMHTFHNLLYYYSDVKWPTKHLNLPASCLFIQLLEQADIKRNIKALHYTGPLWRESISDWWIPNTKGQ